MGVNHCLTTSRTIKMRACYQRPKHLITCVLTDINIWWGQQCWACGYICYISINGVLNTLELILADVCISARWYIESFQDQGAHFTRDVIVEVWIPYSRDRVVQLHPPASPYIKKSFEGILMYEMAGGFINKYVNYADPAYREYPKIVNYPSYQSLCVWCYIWTCESMVVSYFRVFPVLDQ